MENEKPHVPLFETVLQALNPARESGLKLVYTKRLCLLPGQGMVYRSN